MTPTLTDAIANAVIYRAWNRGDLDAMDEVVAPDYVRHLSDGRTLRSRDEFKQHIATARAVMPDLHSGPPLLFRRYARRRPFHDHGHPRQWLRSAL